MRHDEVVLEKNQYASPSDRGAVTESVREAVRLVFDSGLKVTDEPIRFFYASKYSEGRFHNSAACAFVVEIGGHRFYKEAGT